MAKVKTKIESSSELNEIFGQLVDPLKCDPEVVYPKYIELTTKIRQLARIMIAAGKSPLSKVFDAAGFDIFVKKGNAMLASLEVKYTLGNIVTNWVQFKDSMPVQTSIKMCAYLSRHRQYVMTHDDHWIKKLTLGTRLFDFTDIDIHLLWCDPLMNQELKNYILKVFEVIYQISLEVYNISTSPDIDVDKFSRVMVTAIQKIQKVPEMSRCKIAFGRISDSVNLLKDNFGCYYKDFLQTQNPTIIMENFVIDVGRAQTSNPRLKREFRIIINYFKKISITSNKDPRLKMMLNVLDSQMNLMNGADDIDDKDTNQVEDEEYNKNDKVEDDEDDKVEDEEEDEVEDDED